ncbi:MAG: phosphate acyltransferase PlsX [Bacteroidales bacterium]|nr:phosphate acyltransferase PlsX [Bacteroidales bacterium]
MRLGLDVMGGDFAPEATILGAIQANKELQPEVELLLIGNEETINEILVREDADLSQFTIVNAPEVIEMGDHPAKAFSKKPNSSISVGFGLLKGGKIDGFASAGNTGAMLVGVHYAIKTIPGIIRPAIATFIPTESDIPTLILDVGLNPDSKPDVLYQYGILGSVYAKGVWDIENPRIALLNIGSEESKGNLVVRSAYEMMLGSEHFNFVGNIEGNDLFSNDKADVIVCDGFVGNVVLKEGEAFYKLLRKRKVKDEFFERFNFENFGGSPILGATSVVVIGHGISNAKAIKNMILHTRDMIEAGLAEKITLALK